MWGLRKKGENQEPNGDESRVPGSHRVESDCRGKPVFESKKESEHKMFDDAKARLLYT